MFTIRRILSIQSGRNQINQRFIQTTPVFKTFWERDEKSGYKDKRQPPSTTELIRDGFKQLKQEISLWKKELREDFESDPILIYRPGETDIFWKFHNEEHLNSWIVTNDSDHDEGYSTSNLTITKNGKGLFSGELCTRVPKNGLVKRAGYCSIRTVKFRKSFKRETCLDWSPYNVLVLRVRGDGRSYLLNIGNRGYSDILWNDIYHYVLYTRGGPYWQTAKIPFSKFFLSSKGRVQDKQTSISLDKISSFGITTCDKINGQFQLEIDYIGVEYDPNIEEDFAYELYKMPKYIVAT